MMLCKFWLLTTFLYPVIQILRFSPRNLLVFFLLLLFLLQFFSNTGFFRIFFGEFFLEICKELLFALLMLEISLHHLLMDLLLRSLIACFVGYEIRDKVPFLCRFYLNNIHNFAVFFKEGFNNTFQSFRELIFQLNFLGLD